MRRRSDAGSRIPAILLAMPLVAILALTAWRTIPDLVAQRIARRFTVVAVGNPYLVMSFDMTDKSAVLIPVPKDTHIQAAHGYGLYSLEAIYRLDGMDRRQGDLVRASLTDALGYPVDGYMDVSHPSQLLSYDPIADFRSVMATTNLATAILSKRTDISPVMLARIVSQAKSMPDTAIRVIDPQRGNMMDDMKLPDGSVVSTINEQRYDSAVGTLLEDPDIRAEHLRVGVYNTTSMPGLAQRLARILDAAGVFVVAVDSRGDAVKGCLLTGNPEALQSKTASYVIEDLACTTAVRQDDDRADLSVYLGQSTADRYLPYP
jgi:hypothetical protein